MEGYDMLTKSYGVLLIFLDVEYSQGVWEWRVQPVLSQSVLPVASSAGAATTRQGRKPRGK